MTDLLRLPEAAADLRVSERTLRRLIRAGRIRTVRVSPGRVCVERRALDAYRAAIRRAA